MDMTNLEPYILFGQWARRVLNDIFKALNCRKPWILFHCSNAVPRDSMCTSAVACKLSPSENRSRSPFQNLAAYAWPEKRLLRHALRNHIYRKEYQCRTTIWVPNWVSHERVIMVERRLPSDHVNDTELVDTLHMLLAGSQSSGNNDLGFISTCGSDRGERASTKTAPDLSVILIDLNYCLQVFDRPREILFCS